MKPRLSVLTLGVADLERSLAFYRDGLEFETPGIIGEEFEYGAVVFISLEGGLRLALTKARLARRTVESAHWASGRSSFAPHGRDTARVRNCTDISMMIETSGNYGGE